MEMNAEWFLKRLFAGYVRDFARFRWHTTSTYADLTQATLGHFADLGRSLGYWVKREATEGRRPDLVGSGTGGSNPRDLIWIDPDDRATVLHVESENEPANLHECLFWNNKLLDSAKYGDDRLLVAVFGWLKESDFGSLANRIRETEAYRDRALLVIAWIGSRKDDATSLRALLWSGNQCQVRSAAGRLDDDGYWSINFGGERSWRGI